MASGRWHTMTATEAVEALATDLRTGLAAGAVKRRQARYGPNQIDEAEGASPLALLAKQFQDFMVLVLLGAAAISVLLGEYLDATAIAVIVILNGLLGFIQEYRAERSMEALRDLTAPSARVLRGGEELVVPAADLVPGDIVFLFDGDRVPADGRLIEARALAVDESVLTGESAPVSKNFSAVHGTSTAAGDRTNMLFKGTAVTRGRATFVVTDTGMETELGRIAGMMRTVEQQPTPLQRRLAQLGRWLVAACLAIVAVVFAIGVLRGFPVYKMFLTAVSLAVAAIPEGLPAVVTIALALGVQQMLRKRAIVRRLPAVETLGCATVICSDKTGTLTRNEMTVTRLWTPARDVAVTGSGYTAAGEFTVGGRLIDPLKDGDLALAVAIGATCNNARLKAADGETRSRKTRPIEWTVLGDPTEAALLVLAAKAGLTHRREADAVVGELPFDSYRKRMSVVLRHGHSFTVMCKGAPDMLLQRCNRVRRAGRVEPLAASERRRIARVVDDMARQALRVLALAYSERPGGAPPNPDAPEDDWEKDLIFVGLVGMIDPPRPEVKQALRVASGAGIRTVMVTGDHPHTAAAIASELGMIGPREEVVTGAMLDRWSDEDLAHHVHRVSVFARVSPNHKLRIVRALRQAGEVVAMTGDGVNDAPAVKEADIGVAMGRTGTDVTREASDMVLADDNYATIINAVEEGRGIYDNIRKFIRYLLGCNVGEVLTMFFAALAGMPLPLLPMQILWMNLVTDGLPAIALGLDRPAADCMERSPRSPNEGIFSGGMHVKIIGRGIIIACCTLAVFVIALYAGGTPDDRARTLAFTMLVVLQLIYVFQCRADGGGVFARGTRNGFLLAAVGASFIMQLFVLYVPALQKVFGVVPLGMQDWLLIGWMLGWYVVVDALVRHARRAMRRRMSLLKA